MPDRVREALFNLLRGHCEGVRVFDAFAGTGAVGLEAVSRGASACVLVERDRRVASILEGNVRALGVEERCEVVVGDALGAGAIARCPRGVHLVFFDPPYPLVRDPAQWPRVRAQFMRLIDRLDDTGYAVLRTPRPFLQFEKAEVEEVPELPVREPRRARRRRGRAMGWSDGRDIEITEPVEIDPDVPAPETPVRGVAPKGIPVDLRMDNALGPETHSYGSTAIHLYMRRRDAGGATGSGEVAGGA